MILPKRIDRTALHSLHTERFADLPFDCGEELEPGIADADEWRDWSAMPSTPDQLRIESYLDRFDLGGRAILHIGSGNSLLAERFAGRAERIVGTTVVPGEVLRGEALGLANYRVLLHNKYGGAAELAGKRFDFIVDNNPATFCCCLTHFARLIEFYANALESDGQMVTDRVGLGWTMKGANPRWGFSFEDLAAVARLAGLGTFSHGRETIVVARVPPAQPTLGSQARRALRRIRRAFERLWRARSS